MTSELDCLERAVAAWHACIADFCLLQPEGRVDVGPQGTKAYRSGAPVAVLNGLISTTRDAHLEELASMAENFGSDGLPWSIQLRHTRTAPALEQLAAGRGLNHAFTLPFMIKTLGAPDLEVPERPGMDVRVVAMDEGQTYQDALAAGYEAPPAVFAKFSTPSVLSATGMTAFVVCESGVPVSTSFGVLRDGHVGVFNISTRPSHRLRGYGRAATQAVLRHAHQQGAHTAFLHCTPAGRKVYESLAFEVVEEWRVFVAA